MSCVYFPQKSAVDITTSMWPEWALIIDLLPQSELLPPRCGVSMRYLGYGAPTVAGRFVWGVDKLGQVAAAVGAAAPEQNPAIGQAVSFFWGRLGMFAVEVYAAVRHFVFIEGNRQHHRAPWPVVS